jgi:large subunit ribosomal protein L18
LFKSRKYELRAKRKRRIRSVISGTSERPRLSFYKSLNNLYAQLIDDTQGKTIASISTLSKELRDKLKGKKNLNTARELGEKFGDILKEKGIKKVVLDRSGYKYHGKLKSFADAIRSRGIDF